MAINTTTVDGVTYYGIATDYNFYMRGHTYLGTESDCVIYNDMYYKADQWLGQGNGFWAGNALPIDSTTGSLTVDGTKCVKYNDFYNSIVRQPWKLVISEGVSGKTRADTIELRYYYQLTSGGTWNYVSANSYSFGFNINGSASTIHYFEANPFKLYNGSIYASRLGIWCGTTNLKQSWKYKLRNKGSNWSSNGAWGDWTEISGTGNSALVYLPTGTGVTGFLSAMDAYSGVEFYMS